VRASSALTIVLLLLATAGPAESKRRARTDERTGVRFVLDGQFLTLRLLPEARSDTRNELIGQPLRLVCSESYRLRRKTRLVQEFTWPANQDAVSLTLARDISSDVKWCLVESDGGVDVADVPFGKLPGFLIVGTDYDTEGKPRGERSVFYLRLRDRQGRLVAAKRSFNLERLVAPGRYRIIRFERPCLDGCDRLGAPRLRCARRFLVRPNHEVFVQFVVDYAANRCTVRLRARRAG
jgi:hypothetical protein